MKVKENAHKKSSQGKPLKIVITETQFKRLAENVVLLQEQNLIENTYLLKINHNLIKYKKGITALKFKIDSL